MNHERNRLLIELLGKEKINAAAEIAGNERIRFSALQHEMDIMDIEKALAEKKRIEIIALQLNLSERNIRRHRDER